MNRNLSRNRKNGTSFANQFANLFHSFFVQPEMVKAIRQFIAPVLDRPSHVLFVSDVFKIIESSISWITIKMVNLHSFRARADKRLHNQNVDHSRDAIRALTKNDVRSSKFVGRGSQNVVAGIFLRVLRVSEKPFDPPKIANFVSTFKADNRLPHFNIFRDHKLNYSMKLTLQGVVK